MVVPVRGTFDDDCGVVTGLVVVGEVVLSGTVPGGTVVGCVEVLGVVDVAGCCVVVAGLVAPGSVDGCTVLPGTVLGCVVLVDSGVLDCVDDGVVEDGVDDDGVVVCANAAVDPKIASAIMFNFKVFMIPYIC
ncbi:hypothetical protein [Dyadobacter arcticus]|uniref:Uncharacterized protein n=1 Tax=Dyadobacter arcticus TaxID=1078754 RepID=A0ABX0US80_9BACT|nr:hypothetical protein [Dyadobacter arcticus]NIJ55064.1 hypothetical protein [Dyadobacter arcticus]